MRAAEHLALQHFEAVDMPFDRPRAPGQCHAGRGEQSREEGAGRDRWLVQWSAAASVSAVCWCSGSTVLAAAAA